MHKYRFTELVCLILTGLFIFFSLSDRKNTVDMTASEISDKICSELSSELISRDKAFVREKLGFDTEVFESFVYFSSDDIMNVREIFIGVSENKVDATVIKAVESYISEKFVLYNGYAPEAAALLNSAVIECCDNVFILTVSENADKIISAFNSLV